MPAIVSSPVGGHQLIRQGDEFMGASTAAGLRFEDLQGWAVCVSGHARHFVQPGSLPGGPRVFGTLKSMLIAAPPRYGA
jgi:hypothetical protein